MEPWEVMISESQERMVAVVRPQMLEHVLAVCERWELHNAVIGEVTDTGLLRRSGTTRSSARSRRGCSPTSARATIRRAEAARRARPRRPSRTHPRIAEALARAARLATTSAAAHTSTGATTISSARAPSGGPGSTPPCCGCGRATAVSPSRSTAPAGWGGSTRAPAAGWRCSRRRATSPARAPSRSA